jgi:dUTPase
MRLTIKVKRLNMLLDLPEVIEKGDWIDLRASENVIMHAPQAGTLQRHKVNGEEVSHRDVKFDFKLIPLGVAMKLPKGFEAVVLPRSSTAKKFGIIQANSQGVIDHTYQGDGDEWKYPALAIRDTVIHEGDRICQFRIQLSQKATVWQKLKWLFSSGVKIKEVESLGGTDRDGFGSTGVQ